MYTQDVTIAAGQTGDATAACPATMRAFGGGVGAVTANPPLHQIQISEPLDSNGQHPKEGAAITSWKGSIYNYGSSSGTFRVYALCSASSDAVASFASIYPVNGGSSDLATNTVDRMCNEHGIQLGSATGGGIGTDSSLSPPPDYLTTLGPVGDSVTWRTGFSQFSGDARTYEIIAICSVSAEATALKVSATLPANGSASKTAFCPEGTRVIGGGATIEWAGLGKAISDSAPVGKGGIVPNNLEPAYGWTASAISITKTPDVLDVYALCVTEQTAPPTTTTTTPTTTTTTPSTTTTTPTTTTTTVTTTTTTAPITKKLAASLVSVTVVEDKQGERTLDVKIHVARPVAAHVQLLGQHSAVALSRTRALLPRSTTLALALCPSIEKGSYRLAIDLSDEAGGHKALVATILVPK